MLGTFSNSILPKLHFNFSFHSKFHSSYASTMKFLSCTKFSFFYLFTRRSCGQSKTLSRICTLQFFKLFVLKVFMWLKMKICFDSFNDVVERWWKIQFSSLFFFSTGSSHRTGSVQLVAAKFNRLALSFINFHTIVLTGTLTLTGKLSCARDASRWIQHHQI